MSWKFHEIQFSRLVENEARKNAARRAAAAELKEPSPPAESAVEAFRYLVRQNDIPRLKAWMAQRAPDEVAFFRTLWKDGRNL
jgi:hypothetical protein